MTDEPTILVPESWLKCLEALADRVRSQMDDGPDTDYSVYIKTDISALVGYALSAKTIIKHNPRKETVA